MKTLHQAMTGIALLVVLIVSLGIFQPAMVSAWSQHGHGAAQHGHQGAMQHGDMNDPEAHFHALAEHLELTPEQQQTLAEPFNEAFAAMQRLHQLHGEIAAELTDEQQAALAEMVHEMMGAAFGDTPDAR